MLTKYIAGNFLIRLIDLYLENIIVYKEHVDIIVNVLLFFSEDNDDIAELFRKVISVPMETIYGKNWHKKCLNS